MAAIHDLIAQIQDDKNGKQVRHGKAESKL